MRHLLSDRTLVVLALTGQMVCLGTAAFLGIRLHHVPQETPWGTWIGFGLFLGLGTAISWAASRRLR